MKLYRFTKEQNDRWFIVLPEWQGSKDELEMVMGADTMLDYIACGGSEVMLYLSEEPFDGYDLTLTLKEYIYDGAMYSLTGKNFECFDVWLCEVTKFVFGEFPQTIYIK